MRSFYIIILLLFVTCAQAQVTTQEFKTNRPGRSSFPRIMYDDNQSLFIRYLEVRGGQNHVGYKEISKTNLSTLSDHQLGLPSSPNDSVFHLFFVEKNNNFPKYYAQYDSPQLRFYRVAENSGAVIDTLFVHTFPKYLFMSGVTVDFHKGKLYFYYIENNDVVPTRLGDTSRMVVFDTLGNIVNNRYYTWKDSSKAQLPITLLQMQKYPPNEDFILMAEMLFGEMNLYLLDRASLDTIRSIRPPFSYFFDRGYQSTTPMNFDADLDGFQYSGFVEMRNVQGNIFVYDWQGFVHRANWQGDSLELRNFGDPNVDEYSYAYQRSVPHNQQFLSTSTPWNDFRINADENRQVVIYRWNNFGQDSIVLFGQSNHVATDILADDNGDVFVVGTRNNWQGNDENFVWLAKIPNYALSLIAEKKMEARLSLYPNPTQDYLELDSWPSAWPKAVDYKIIGLGAQVVQNGQTAQKDKLNVSSLPQGTYILQLTFKGAQQNILWNKQ
jgi:hypothetical protein